MGSDKYLIFNPSGFKNAELSVLVVIFLVISGIFFTNFCIAATPNNPTSLSSPVGSPTTPVTSQRSGLHKTRSEAHIAERNLAITGNVSGGKHFRDSVPYNSTSQFGASAGSDLFNSFMRRSSGSTTGYTSPGRYNSYYSPSKTVTSLKRDGGSGLRAPVNSFAGGTGKYKLPPNSSYKSNLPPLRQNVRPGSIDNEKPFSLSPDEIAKQIETYSDEDKVNFDEEGRGLYNELKVSERINRQLEKEIEADLNKASEEKKVSKTQDEERLQEIEKSNQVMDPDRALEIIKERYRKAQNQGKEDKANEIAEMQKRLIYPEDQQGSQEFDSEPDAFGRKNSDKSADARKNASDEPVSKYDDVNRQMKHFRDTHVSLTRERAQQAIDEFAKFEQKADRKYNMYMQTAEEKIKAGKYYTARDCYELARIWNDDDGGRARMGKAFAALAAGEFVSSSNNVVWAIEEGGKKVIARFKPADLIDPVLLKKRIEDVKVLNEESGFYKTIFLQAFMAYHNGNAAEASDCLEATAVIMSDSKAWKTLKTAIEQMPKRKK